VALLVSWLVSSALVTLWIVSVLGPDNDPRFRDFTYLFATILAAAVWS